MHPNLLATLQSYACAVHQRDPADILKQAELRRIAEISRARRQLLRCVESDLQSP